MELYKLDELEQLEEDDRVLVINPDYFAFQQLADGVHPLGEFEKVEIEILVDHGNPDYTKMRLDLGVLLNALSNPEMLKSVCELIQKPRTVN